MMQGRRAIYALPIAFWLAASGANAQSGTGESLEQTYARLCADGKQNEACEALRTAMLQKLSGRSSPTAISTASSARSGAASVSPRWGFWSQLPGTTWLADNGSLYSYSWEREGAVLTAEVLTANDAYNPVFTLSPSGSSLDLRIGSRAYTLQPLADGSFGQASSDKQRTRYTLSADQMTLTFENLTGAGWVAGQTPPSIRRRLQASEISGHKAALAQQRQQVDAMIARAWGVVPRLIDQKFLSTSSEYPQFNSVTTLSWVNRGTDALMSWNYLSTGAPMGWTRVTRDAATGRFEARNHEGMRGDASMTIDGRMRISWDPTRENQKYGTLTHDYYIAGGALQLDGYFMKNGRKGNATTTRYATVTGKSDAQIRTALAQQRQQAAQQAAQARPAKKSGGGLLGAVQGAIGGMAGAGDAGGGLSEVMVGGAVGAVAGGAGVDPGTINASAAAATQAATTSAAPTSGRALTGARSAGGSYPTKPNALNGQQACSMMNESNYRQVSQSGGNDVQLKTMCALAYEHYVSYKRAIAQGYAEADANRTYAAHQQAAQVAIRFYADTRTR